MDLSHLAPKVQQIALMDNEARIAYCDMPVWIKTGSTKSFFDAVARLIELQRIGSRSCIGLIGVSGIGKSTMVERAEALFKTPDATRVIRIDLATCGRHIDLQEIFLSQIGFTENAKTMSNPNGVKRTKERLEQMQAAVCILDEANALIGAKHMLVQSNYTYLRALANSDMGLSVIVVGTEEFKSHLAVDSQCRSRFGLWEVPSWESDSLEFSRFLKTFVKFMPLRKASVLDTREIQADLVNECNGSTREIVKVLVASAKLAIQSGEERIDQELISLSRSMLLPTFGDD
ncbi:TniB family NTP-binding protein [Pseudomonas piscis]|uniref:AAA family ATPase n=1 Tax=Pseudomonas piscis TaxID=2614538 RepID=A0A7X1PM70_9PSED|nr:TniB family NTP-binding protein [Pseudomonas piscis]MQA54267.1 AAA family ATPase [Pseudomonas piscis]